MTRFGETCKVHTSNCSTWWLIKTFWNDRLMWNSLGLQYHYCFIIPENFKSVYHFLWLSWISKWAKLDVSVRTFSLIWSHLYFGYIYVQVKNNLRKSCIHKMFYHMVGFFKVRKFCEFCGCWSFVKFNSSKKRTTIAVLSFWQTHSW